MREGLDSLRCHHQEQYFLLFMKYASKLPLFDHFFAQKKSMIVKKIANREIIDYDHTIIDNRFLGLQWLHNRLFSRVEWIKLLLHNLQILPFHLQNPMPSWYIFNKQTSMDKKVPDWHSVIIARTNLEQKQSQLLITAKTWDATVLH